MCNFLLFPEKENVSNPIVYDYNQTSVCYDALLLDFCAYSESEREGGGYY